MRLLSLLARDVLRAMFVSARVFRATTSSSKSTVSEGREFALSATSSCSSAARAAASEDTVLPDEPRLSGSSRPDFGVRMDSTSESSGDLDSSPQVAGARSSGPREPDVRKEWTSCVSRWFFEASSSTDCRKVESDVELLPPVATSRPSSHGEPELRGVGMDRGERGREI